MRIFLIGYMGSGKSTVGKRLAGKLAMPFYDLDTYIEEKTGQTIPEIFEAEGELTFRKIEHEYLLELFNHEHAVISLGGGTPCYFDNMKLINDNGISIYLKMSVDTLVSRLMQAKTPRPLVAGKSESELRKYVTENLLYRDTYYLQAQYKIKGKSLDVDELAEFVKGICWCE